MSSRSPYQEHRHGTQIDIVVQPRASNTEIVGGHDGAIRVRIAAPPVDGAANAALIELLARILDVRKSDIEIVTGGSGRRKRVLIHGLPVEQVREMLDKAIGEPERAKSSRAT